MSLSNSSCHELVPNDNIEGTEQSSIVGEETNADATTYETLREQFVRPQEQISIFDDNVEDILEMNAAIAMLTKSRVNDPLEEENELCQEEQKLILNQDDLEQTTTAVLAKLHEQQNDNLLYDSDGNPIEMYDYDVIYPKILII